MTQATGDERYRNAIDRLVSDCRDGQGQIGADRARRGVWNPHAESAGLNDQLAINHFLDRLPEADRSLLADMLEQAFVGGVHQTLASLYEMGVEPFDKAYEGTPFHDFIGRLRGWEWPANRTRST